MSHPQPSEIWTVGHSTRTAEELLAMLTSFTIEVVVDVRRVAASRRNPHFGKDALARALAAAGVAYAWMPELGGRRDQRPDSRNNSWREAAFRGYADYMETADFRDGLARLLAASAARRSAIMCAEADWRRCHRGLLADALKVRGIAVTHISGIGEGAAHPYTAAARIVDGELSYEAPGEGRLF